MKKRLQSLICQFICRLCLVLCLWSGVRPLQVGVLRKRLDRTGTLAASHFDVGPY